MRYPEGRSYIEALFSNYKTDEIFRKEYHSYEEVKEALQSYREWYKHDRIHQRIDYMSPVHYAQRAQKSIVLVA
ncbi:MAG: IS3 family transposase [Fibrobacter sp.]|nr:IS3 family transposase [Fibrobacter sp.]